MRPIKPYWLDTISSSLVFPNPYLLLSPSIDQSTTTAFALDWKNAIYSFAASQSMSSSSWERIIRLYQKSLQQPMTATSVDEYDELRMQYLHRTRLSPWMTTNHLDSSSTTSSSAALSRSPSAQLLAPPLPPLPLLPQAQSLTHVVFAFHDSASSLAKLRDTVNEWWMRYPPCLAATADWHCAGPKPHLVFLMMTTASSPPLQPDFIQTHFPNLTTTFATCFASSSVCAVKLDAKDSTHFTGSRLSFEAFLRHQFCGDAAAAAAAPPVGYGLYMEADLKPVRRMWLTALQYRVRHSAPFFVLGSAFHGDTAYAKQLPSNAHRYHVNSNAVYNLREFPAVYFDHIRPYIARTVPIGQETAMDLDVFRYVFGGEGNDDRLRLLTQVQYTATISNRYMARWRLHQLAGKRSPTLLVHGGNLVM